MISQTKFTCKFNDRYDFINKLKIFRPSKMVTAATKNNTGYIQQNAIMAVVFLRVNILLYTSAGAHILQYLKINLIMMLSQ
jgi:hypothetical protein